MCIMLTESEPESTRLFNIPVNVGDSPHKLLLYTNDLAAKDPQIMIVPIPNPSASVDFGLVDATKLKSFRSQINGLFPQPRSKAITMNSLSGSRNAAPLIVHSVGNYNISVAPTVDDLNKRIDWKKFKLPKDFDRRKATLVDQTLFPFPCAYVVAQATKSVKDDGFGVVYPDPGFDYFPTAHEDNGESFTRFDVVLYDCYAPPAASRMISSLSTGAAAAGGGAGGGGRGDSVAWEGATDKAGIERLFHSFPLDMKLSDSGIKTTFSLNKCEYGGFVSVNRLKMQGQFPNFNVMLPGAVDPYADPSASMDVSPCKDFDGHYLDGGRMVLVRDGVVSWIASCHFPVQDLKVTMKGTPPKAPTGSLQFRVDFPGGWADWSLRLNPDKSALYGNTVNFADYKDTVQLQRAHVLPGL